MPRRDHLSWYSAGIPEFPGDWALISSLWFSWEDSNRKRPDLYYRYEKGSQGSKEVYAPNGVPKPSRFVHDPLWWNNELRLVFPGDLPDDGNADDTYEIFAYDAEARSHALGAMAPIAGFGGFDLSKPPLSYNNEHYAHSRQFRSNIVDENTYWEQVIKTAKLPKTN